MRRRASKMPVLTIFVGVIARASQKSLAALFGVLIAKLFQRCIQLQ